MQKQFTPCPACGAVGEIGKKCPFCGTTITHKDGVAITDSRLVKQRTVTPRQYAEKITIYHNIKSYADGMLSEVTIGEMHGLINLNGDIVYPLDSYDIGERYGNAIELGSRHEETIGDTTTYWDEYSQKWIIESPDTYEDFRCYQYFNIENSQYADLLGFVKDNKEPQKLYRVNVKNGWTPIQTYTNLDNEKHSYDYAEKININDIKRTIYLLHQGDRCSLWILYDESIDAKYFNVINLSYKEKEYAINGNPDFPSCILEGIQKFHEIKKEKNKLLLCLKTYDGIEIALTLAKYNNRYSRWEEFDFDKIYTEWNKAIGKQQELATPDKDNNYNEEHCNEVYTCEKNNDNKSVKAKDTKSSGGYSKIEWIIAIVGMILYSLYKLFA